MNARTTLSILACIICGGSVWAVFGQRQHLTALRQERDKQLASISPSPISELSLSSGRNQTADASPGGTSASSELLRLRSQVTQLTARKQELTGILKENERLRAELDASQTNKLGRSQLPDGYIRKAQAHFAGYNTPENTFQSFLYALRNHDSTMLLQSLTQGAAQRIQNRLQDPMQAAGFFKEMDVMPGLALQNRQELPDHSVQYDVEIAPGIPKQTLRLELISGEWKLELP